MVAVKAKTLADFRAAHDPNVIVPTKIRNALAQMEKEGGPENWEYEGDFIKRSGVSQGQMGQFRSEFEAHVVETASNNGRAAKRVWIANAKAAAKFRGE